MTRDELLAKHGIPKPILDHGLVTFVDYMGDDKAVVDMARKSYGQGTQSVSDDEVLLRYLMRNHHAGPFEGVVAKFVIKCPIFVARQLMRHRTGAYDEVSLRYSEAEEEFWIPDEMPTQAKDNKQGSGAPLALEASDCLRADFAKSYHDNYALYKLGWVYFNLREFRRTIDTFQQVVKEVGNGSGLSRDRDRAGRCATRQLVVIGSTGDGGN